MYVERLLGAQLTFAITVSQVVTAAYESRCSHYVCFSCVSYFVCSDRNYHELHSNAIENGAALLKIFSETAGSSVMVTSSKENVMKVWTMDWRPGVGILARGPFGGNFWVPKKHRFIMK